MRSLIRPTIFFLSLGIFLTVILFLPAPLSWPDASFFQIAAFFLPLLIWLTLLLDFFISYIPHSFILVLGLLLALSFYAVGQLNILTGLLVLLITLLSWRIFPKMKLPRFRLTVSSKIPKLHMRKQEPPKRRGIRRLRTERMF